jgi:uncharacterized iron-regulated membrane protein
VVRRVFVLAHRYVGLGLAVFLILEGLTGSILAYRQPLERAINPQFFADPPSPGARPLGLGELAVRAERIAPEAKVDYLYIRSNQVFVRVEPRDAGAHGDAAAIGFDQLFLDPWTGKELGRRLFGDLRQGRSNWLSFVDDLHTSLRFGQNGATVLGIVAILWTLDCFTALYLTLPRTSAGFLRRWAQAWRVKWSAGSFRLSFDLHRAGGLWPWPLLGIFAFSSFMLAMPERYNALVAALLPTSRDLVVDETKFPVRPRRIGWLEAQAIGERLLTRELARRGIDRLAPADEMAYIEDFGAYTYSARTKLDVRGDQGDSGVFFDANTGAFREFAAPTGHDVGASLGAWLYALHFADYRSNPVYRAGVGVLGIVIAMLSVTGIVIWLGKRRARKRSRKAAAAASPP